MIETLNPPLRHEIALPILLSNAMVPLPGWCCAVAGVKRKARLGPEEPKRG